MRITVMGTGYVGLVTGVCLADTGNTVIGFDIDVEKIARLREGVSPIFEPGPGAVLRELYLPVVRNQSPILMVKRQAAEMIKYAANAYLATRISFINQVATLCEAVGVEVDEVIRGIGADARIGYQFLYPG